MISHLFQATQDARRPSSSSIVPRVSSRHPLAADQNSNQQQRPYNPLAAFQEPRLPRQTTHLNFSAQKKCLGMREKGDERRNLRSLGLGSSSSRSSSSLAEGYRMRTLGAQSENETCRTRTMTSFRVWRLLPGGLLSQPSSTMTMTSDTADGDTRRNHDIVHTTQRLRISRMRERASHGVQPLQRESLAEMMHYFPSLLPLYLPCTFL